jgi:hypothetical protein
MMALYAGWFASKKQVACLPLRTQHGAAQYIVQSALVTAALAFEPFQHVCIYPQGKLLFDGQIKLAALCIRVVLKAVFICSKIYSASELIHQ